MSDLSPVFFLTLGLLIGFALGLAVGGGAVSWLNRRKTAALTADLDQVWALLHTVARADDPAAALRDAFAEPQPPRLVDAPPAGAPRPISKQSEH
jgi:hypothetical protein